MEYFGGYFGLGAPAPSSGGSTPEPVLVEAPYTPADPEYFDHTTHAINRLCEYAKAKAT